MPETQIEFNEIPKNINKFIFQNVQVIININDYEGEINFEFLNCQVIFSSSLIANRISINNTHIIFNPQQKDQKILVQTFETINSTFQKLEKTNFKTQIFIQGHGNFTGNYFKELQNLSLKTQIESQVTFINNSIQNSTDIELDFSSDSNIEFKNNFFMNLTHHSNNPMLTLRSQKMTLIDTKFSMIDYSSKILVKLISSDYVVLQTFKINAINGLSQIKNSIIRVNAKQTQIFRLIVENVTGSNLEVFNSEDCQLLNVQDSLFNSINSSMLIDNKFGQTNITRSSFNQLKINSNKPLFSFTELNIRNCTFTNIKARVSIIQLSEMAKKVELIDSLFFNVQSVDKGSILNINGFKNIAKINNCIFRENSAVSGGVAHITNNASVIFTNCNFVSNFALMSGTIYIVDPYQLKIINSTFIKNFAFANSILYLEFPILLEIRNFYASQNRVFSPQLFLGQHEFSTFLASNNINLEENLDEYYLSWKQKKQYFLNREFSYQLSFINCIGKLYNITFYNQSQILFTSRTSTLFINQMKVSYTLIEVQGQLLKKQSLFYIENFSQLQFPGKVFIQNIHSNYNNESQIIPYIFILQDQGIVFINDTLRYQNSSVHFIQNIKNGDFTGINIIIENIMLPWFNIQVNEENYQSFIVAAQQSKFAAIGNFQINFLRYQNQFKSIKPNLKDRKKIELPSIIQIFDIGLLEIQTLNISQIKNLSNCRIIYSDTNSKIRLSNIEIFNRTIDSSLKNINFEDKQALIFAKDTNVEVQKTKFQEIFSQSGASVFEIFKTNKKYQLYKRQTPDNFKALFEDCEFSNNIGEQSAVSIRNLNSAVVRSKFYNNTSLEGNGGALSIFCSDHKMNHRKHQFYINEDADCISNLLTNVFSFNTAQKGMSGAVHFNRFVSLIGLDRNIFNQNYALLQWQDYLQLFDSLTVLDAKMSINSGQNLNLKIAFLNQQGHIIEEEVGGVVKVIDYGQQLNILKGVSEVNTSKGIAYFTNLSIIAQPGSSFNLTVSGFQKNLSEEKRKLSLLIVLIGLTIKLQVNNCSEGEIIQNMSCVPCRKGFYTFESNSTKCNSCFENAQCLGRNFTSVLPGYWREHPKSINIQRCRKFESCLQVISQLFYTRIHRTVKQR